MMTVTAAAATTAIYSHATRDTLVMRPLALPPRGGAAQAPTGELPPCITCALHYSDLE
jgi:hypothetical protein